jgi:hypothetical protein
MPLSVAEKAIGVIRHRLYSIINGRSAVTPKMAVRFEEQATAAPTCGLGCRPPMTTRKCASPKKRSECDALRGRYDGSHFRPALVEKVADRTPIGARTLIAARQGFADANRDGVAVPGTATRTSQLIGALARSLIGFTC